MIYDTKKEKDWPEDFPHENGMYYCRCVHCKEQFIGYKRRVVCKECSIKPTKDPWDQWKPSKDFV